MNVNLAILLNKIVHDAQDEHGLKTRHDIGLVLVKELEAAGAQIVREKTIDHRDDYGGWSWDVLDYDIPKRGKVDDRYLVMPLGSDPLVVFDEVFEDNPEAEATEHEWDDLTSDEQEEARGIGTEADDEQETV